MWFRRDVKYVVYLNQKERQLLRKGLLEFRSMAISKGIPTDDIDRILSKIM